MSTWGWSSWIDYLQILADALDKEVRISSGVPGDLAAAKARALRALGFADLFPLPLIIRGV